MVVNLPGDHDFCFSVKCFILLFTTMPLCFTFFTLSIARYDSGHPASVELFPWRDDDDDIRLSIWANSPSADRLTTRSIHARKKIKRSLSAAPVLLEQKAAYISPDAVSADLGR
jgi:hypothetical protein